MRGVKHSLLCCGLVLIGATRAMPAQSAQTPAAPLPQPRSDSSRSALAGAFTLVSVDGQRVPATITHQGAPPDAAVLAATMLVRPDGSFLQAMAYRATVGGEQRFMARPFSGRITTDGAAYTAHWDGAGMTPVTLSRDTLVITNEGMRFEYVKGRR